MALIQNTSVDGMETVLSELEESCTISILTDAGSSRSQKSVEHQSHVNAILNSMSGTLSTSLETRIAYHYELVLFSKLHTLSLVGEIFFKFYSFVDARISHCQRLWKTVLFQLALFEFCLCTHIFIFRLF